MNTRRDHRTHARIYWGSRGAAVIYVQYTVHRKSTFWKLLVNYSLVTSMWLAQRGYSEVWHHRPVVEPNLLRRPSVESLTIGRQARGTREAVQQQRGGVTVTGSVDRAGCRWDRESLCPCDPWSSGEQPGLLPADPLPADPASPYSAPPPDLCFIFPFQWQVRPIVCRLPAPGRLRRPSPSTTPNSARHPLSAPTVTPLLSFTTFLPQSPLLRQVPNLLEPLRHRPPPGTLN
jgi:hypothetical protein